jgi:hypothetical protein
MKTANLFTDYKGVRLVVGFVDSHPNTDNIAIDLASILPIARQLQKDGVEFLEAVGMPFEEKFSGAHPISSDIQITLKTKRIHVGHVYTTGDDISNMVYHVKILVDVILDRYDRVFLHLHPVA